MAAESAIPGFLQWHAALALLAPGMWVMACAVGVRIAPGERFRLILAYVVGVIALGLIALIIRADQLLGRWWGDLNGGFIHAGLVAIVLAAGAAGYTAWRTEGDPARRLWQGGGVYLLVAWGLPVGALAATGAMPSLLRWVFVPLVVIAMLFAMVHPTISQLAGALIVVVAAPSWRPAGLVTMGVAGAAWWWPGAT